MFAWLNPIRPVFQYVVLFTGLIGAQVTVKAQTIFLPPSFADTGGGNTVNVILNRDARTMQLYIAASELTGLGSGKKLTGLAFRLSATASQSSALSFADFEIRIGQLATAIGSISTTFADNISNSVLVRDGALTFAANSFASAVSPAPAALGPYLTFNTPYEVVSGPGLVIEIRHTGTGLTSITVDSNNDAELYGNVSGRPYFAMFANTGADATVQSGSSTKMPIIALTYSAAVPEPSSYASMVGLAMLGLAATRRRRVSKTHV